MRDADPHLQIELSTSAYTEYSSGFQTVQPDPLGDGGTMQSMPAYYPCGFSGRPRDPDTMNGEPTNAGNCLVMWEGQRGHAMPLGPDPRVVPKLPPLNKGGAQIYADRDDGKVTFVNLDGKTGGVTFYVPCASKAIALSIDTTNAGAETFQVVHAAGMGFSMVGGGANAVTINNSKGDAFIGVDDNGIVFSGKMNQVGSFNCGIPSTLELATNPAAPQPDGLVMGTQFQLWATTLLSQVQAWAATVVAQCAANTPPIVITPLVLTPFVPTLGVTTKLKGA
jgi:hypothetical protein